MIRRHRSSAALAAATLATLLAFGCARDEPAADAGRGGVDTAAAPPAAGTAARDPVVERFLARVPRDALVRAGACPFECCVYGDWVAETDIPVVAQERGRAEPAFTIGAGEWFRADSGAVHITDVLVVAVEDSVGDPPYWSLARGDTVVVLDYVGEGRYNVWRAGKIMEVEGFWSAGASADRATTYGRWGSEWWVHAVLRDGRTGWFLASPDVRFRGADACGGPPEN